MKKLMLSIVVLALFPIGMLLAQSPNITGTWQGTLHGGRGDLRTVIKISKADGGALKAVLYSIDQGGQALAASAITSDGSSVKISLATINGAFEGKLNADGSSMVGTWTQGAGSTPLTLDRANSETAWIIPGPPKPMAADADPAFEVATIKPSNPNTPGKVITIRGVEFTTFNTTLSDLITFAYGLHARQLVGGPDWFEKDKYDLTAKPDGEGRPNDKQLKIMVQKLVADRFQFTFHREKRELSVYAVVLGKSGSKLIKSAGDPNSLPGVGFTKLGVLHAVNASMADFTYTMEFAVLDRPVVDQTGLPGKYDFTLSWTPTEDQFVGMGARVPQPAADDPAAFPDLFTAIQEQLGLRLESTKAPVDVLVIDRVEKPSAN